MSRAFVKEDGPEPDDSPPERPVSGLPNYVTANGLRRLEDWEKRLLDELAAKPEKKRKKILERDLRYAQNRLQTAIPVSAAPKDEIRFGANVLLKKGDGAERRLMIVGEDEAEQGGDYVSYASPFADALLGLKTGQSLNWNGEAWTVAAVSYAG